MAPDQAPSVTARPPGPRRLAPGDLVACVAPAGPAYADQVGAGVAELESWGLRVRTPAVLPAAEVPWLAGTDAARADAIGAAWCDPEVAAVWTLRGGVGSHRVVDLLDWGAIAATVRSRPAPLLVGYSDVTALHQAFASRVGTHGVHGAGVASLPGLDDDARAAVRALVMDGVTASLRGRPGREGTATAPVTGGNLTVLAAGAGTGAVAPARGSIALLEDVAEQPYRLDRALTQLRRSGWLDGVLGVACGQFTRCGEPDDVRELLLLRLGDLGVPVVTDLPVGHDPDSRPVPFGVPLRLDGGAGVLEPIGSRGPQAPLRPRAGW